ncbi:MAG TPA: hypothetical protein PKH10_00645 [bacterium]|nr:hypothetical protein [bacterium]
MTPSEPRGDRPDRAARLLAVLLACAVALSIYLYFSLSRTRAELQTARQEQMKLMGDYKAALEDNHKLLTRSLSERYLDSLIDLRNRIEHGATVNDEEKKQALDRASFIVDNMGSLDLPPEEAKLRLQFLVTVKNLLAPPPPEGTEKK